jgi:hypothetical protein
MTAGPRTRTPKARAKTARPKPRTNGSNGSRKRTDLAKEVATELKSLRSALDEMMEHYRLRAAAQINELLQAVEGEATVNGSAAKLPAATVSQRQLELLREAKLKPQKGRAKDFARLDDLLEELVALLPAES